MLFIALPQRKVGHIHVALAISLSRSGEIRHVNYAMNCKMISGFQCGAMEFSCYLSQNGGTMKVESNMDCF